MATQCHACGYELKLEVKVARRDTCDNCDADLHCCMNCKFFERNGNRCRENVAAWERDRDKSNFCSSFTFLDSEGNRADEISDAKAKLNALFKKF